MKRKTPIFILRPSLPKNVYKFPNDYCLDSQYLKLSKQAQKIKQWFHQGWINEREVAFYDYTGLKKLVELRKESDLLYGKYGGASL